jgi:hypothetical protein
MPHGSDPSYQSEPFDFPSSYCNAYVLEYFLSKLIRQRPRMSDAICYLRTGPLRACPSLIVCEYRRRHAKDVNHFTPLVVCGFLATCSPIVVNKLPC